MCFIRFLLFFILPYTDEEPRFRRKLIRTSTHMLKRIVDAYDDRLPDDAHIVFVNIGMKREETLNFFDI